MVEYTYEDIIINPQDPRVEIGKTYYFALGAQACIDYANRGVRERTLERIDESLYNPFIGDEKDYPFIIRKKEPWKKYVPFDLSKEEDRGQLKGRWIRKKDNSEIKLIWWLWELDGKWMIDEDINPQQLLNDWVFEDGSPCGLAVEEDEQ